MWLLVVVFMVHDFEEIVMMQPWLRKNGAALDRRFPRIAPRLSGIAGLSTPAFALVVSSIFVLLSGAIMACVELGLYSLYFAILVVFSAHLFVHIGTFLFLRRYVPVIVTSLLALPYSAYALIAISRSGLVAAPEAIAWTAVVIAIVGADMAVMFRAARRFDLWLAGWSAHAEE